MRESKFEAQINLRVREVEKEELKKLSDKLDLETAQLARIALRRGMKLIRERGIQNADE
jgi:hypothetical protein